VRHELPKKRDEGYLASLFGTVNREGNSMTVKPIEAIVLIILAVLSFAMSAKASEVGNFQSEWCSINRFRQTSDVDQICFGRANFLGTSITVRAIGFRFADGHNELYVESQFPKIELLNLDFEIVGPVRDASRTEFGRVVLSIDEDGEVNAVQGQSGLHGRFVAFRDSRDQLP
jgi:hypothetical protein